MGKKVCECEISHTPIWILHGTLETIGYGFSCSGIKSLFFSNGIGESGVGSLGIF